MKKSIIIITLVIDFRIFPEIGVESSFSKLIEEKTKKSWDGIIKVIREKNHLNLVNKTSKEYSKFHLIMMELNLKSEKKDI